MFQNFVNYLTAVFILGLLIVIAVSFGVLTLNRDDDLADLDLNKSIGG